MELSMYHGPTDEQSEVHLPPCPDDADFDAPPAGSGVGVWGMLVAYDHEIRALKRRVKELEEIHHGGLPVTSGTRLYHS